MFVSGSRPVSAATSGANKSENGVVLRQRRDMGFASAGAQPVDEKTDHHKTDGQHCPELWIVEFFAHGFYRLEKVTVLDTENFL